MHLEKQSSYQIHICILVYNVTRKTSLNLEMWLVWMNFRLSICKYVINFVVVQARLPATAVAAQSQRNPKGVEGEANGRPLSDFSGLTTTLAFQHCSVKANCHRQKNEMVSLFSATN